MVVLFDFNNSKINNLDKNKLVVLENYSDFLNNFIKNKDYSSEHSFLLLPFEQKFLKESQDLIKKSNPSLVVVVGIGGSNLGAWAVAQALKGRYFDLLEKKKLLFADCSDPILLNQILLISSEYLKNNKKVLFLLISKSFSTLESISNFSFLYNYLKKNLKNKKLQIGFLCNESIINKNKDFFEKFFYLPIPDKVVGRYSVFSNVGLAPLSFINIDIKKLLAGAKDCTLELLNNKKDVLFNSVMFLYNNYPTKKIFVNFCFSPSLEK
jgi:glucose-6-phosphate isomerase